MESLGEDGRVSLACGELSKTFTRIFKFYFRKVPYLKTHNRASLAAQWLRVCLPMQGTHVRALA